MVQLEVFARAFHIVRRVLNAQRSTRTVTISDSNRLQFYLDLSLSPISNVMWCTESERRLSCGIGECQAFYRYNSCNFVTKSQFFYLSMFSSFVTSDFFTLSISVALYLSDQAYEQLHIQ